MSLLLDGVNQNCPVPGLNLNAHGQVASGENGGNGMGKYEDRKWSGEKGKKFGRVGRVDDPYLPALADGKEVSVFNRGLGTIPQNGTVYLEGPHFPEPHKWYAQGTLQDGKLVRVK